MIPHGSRAGCVVTVRVVLLLLLAGLLVACGSGSAERPAVETTRSLAATPTVSVTLPSVTRSPERTGRPAPSVTRSPSPVATPEPTRTVTRTVIASPAPTPSSTPAPSPTPSTVGQPAEDVPPTWVWWLVGGIAVVLAAGLPLLAVLRRRSAWHSSLTEAENDVGWFARELVPDLRRAGTEERLAGRWAVLSGRVVAMEDRLTQLEATAPDDADRRRARVLRDAVRAARVRLDDVVSRGSAPELALDLDDVASGLEAALRPPPETD